MSTYSNKHILRKLSPKDREEIAQFVANNIETPNIKKLTAEHFNITLNRVNSICKGREDCNVQKAASKSESYIETVRLHKQGLSTYEIAKKLGISRSTVRDRTVKRTIETEDERNDVRGFHPALTVFLPKKEKELCLK